MATDVLQQTESIAEAGGAAATAAAGLGGDVLRSSVATEGAGPTIRKLGGDTQAPKLPDSPFLVRMGEPRISQTGDGTAQPLENQGAPTANQPEVTVINDGRPPLSNDLGGLDTDPGLNQAGEAGTAANGNSSSPTGEVENGNGSKQTAQGSVEGGQASADGAPVKDANAEAIAEWTNYEGDLAVPLAPNSAEASSQDAALNASGDTTTTLTAEQKTAQATLDRVKAAGGDVADIATRMQRGEEVINPYTNKPFNRGEVQGLMDRQNDIAAQQRKDASTNAPAGTEQDATDKQASTEGDQVGKTDRLARKTQVESDLQSLKDIAQQRALTAQEAERMKTLGKELKTLNTDPVELRRQAVDKASRGEELTPEEDRALQSDEVVKEMDPAEADKQAQAQIAELLAKMDEPGTTPEEEVALANQIQEIADKNANIRRTKEEKDKYNQQAKDILNPEQGRLAKMTEEERKEQKEVRDRIMQLRAAERRLDTQKQRLDKLIGDYKKQANELRPYTSGKLEDLPPEQRDQAYEKYLALNAVVARIDVTSREGEIIRNERRDAMQDIRRKLGVTHGLSAMVEFIGAKIDNKIDDIQSDIKNKIGFNEFATVGDYFRVRDR